MRLDASLCSHVRMGNTEMANMSYCRFENTARDLQDCVAAMEDASSLEDLELNKYELMAFYEMFDIARDFLAEHARLLNEEATAE